MMHVSEPVKVNSVAKHMAEISASMSPADSPFNHAPTNLG